ncbi:hypothetical protein Slin14017_G127420 [Septoria linicola]|nr:hypothetical protein Slin14017_G127420 [Septoria linicola]
MSGYDDPERSPLGERGMNVLPASQYLQERLNERRARQLRPKRARHTDFGVQPMRGRDDDIFFSEAEEGRNTRMYDSSPIVAASSRGSDAGTSSSDRRRRALGVRDMDDQMDRLHKQNFALKLELDHRRELTQKLQQQIQSMQEQVDRALVMEDEHKELLRINSQLVQELEKRDKAVEEAMDIICDLEEQVGELQEHGSTTRPSTSHVDSGYAGTEVHDQDLRSSPPRVNAASKTPVVNIEPPSSKASAASQKLQGILESQTPAKPKRQPSVLSSRKPSTNALRSVYLENSKSLRPVQSFQSLMEKQETKPEEDLPDSPRLSVLSESSFPSIYSPKKALSPDQHAWEAADTVDSLAASLGSHAHMRQDSIKRVSQWMSARDAVEATPSKSNHISSPLQDESDAHSVVSLQEPYRSLNVALTGDAQSVPLEPAPELRQFQRHLRKQKMGISQPRPTSYAGPTFSEHHMPPTPESVSTRMLRESRSSIIKDKSLNDVPHVAVADCNIIDKDSRTAPRQMRSSVELRTAFASNMHFRNTTLDGHQIEDSSDDEYVRDDARDAPVDTIKDFGVEYDGFPDGKSISRGTPSRFQSHSRQLPDVMFNHNDLSPTLKPRVPRRRRSSEQTISISTKPRFERTETSPTMFATLREMGTTRGALSSGLVVSPRSARSHQSGSSGGQTIHADENTGQALSPATSRMTSFTSPRSRTSPSPARTLSKKMPNFIRRLSNTMNSEKPPLPTLTSTPSSAYVNSGPRRPRTSHADRGQKDNGGTTIARPPSSRETRPPPPARAKTEMQPARPASAAGTEREKRSLFRRSNSVKNAESQDDLNAEAQDRGALQKRRGSIRDAVISRRPWR